MRRILFLVLVIAFFLVGIWFKEGYIIGGSEDGLIFYNISRYFNQAEYTWMEYPGLGSPSLTQIAGKPTYFLLAYLQKTEIPGFIIQAGVMWFLLVSSGMGIYFLSREFFPKLPQKYIFLSIIFYWFNPIALFVLLNRSLLNYIFFFAMLPIASYCYIKGLRSRKYVWALVLNILLVIYSYVFSYVAFTISFWLWLSLLTFNFIVFNKIKLFALKYFLLNLILFIASHCWWFLPMTILSISGGVNSISSSFLNQDNIGTLDALSKSSGNLNGIFKLINLSLLSADSLSWLKTYYSPILFTIQYFFVGAILYFIIKFRKDHSVLFLGSLFLTIIFLAKGNNPPFGEIYNFLFKHISTLQVFRNPFEKLSFFLSLTASILIGPGIYALENKLQSNLRKLFYSAILTMIILYLGFPLYSGLALTNKFPPTNDYSTGYKVLVPQYYKEVDEWLINQGNNFRFLGFPIKDEGVTYKWEKGYSGVELAVPLFSHSGIIHNTSVPFFNLLVPQIEKILLSDKDFSLFANLVNAKFYLLRYDLDTKNSRMTDSLVIEDKLKEREEKGEMKKVVEFGKVSIWENLKWRDNTFYAANKFTRIENFDKTADPVFDLDVLSGEILVNKDDFGKLLQEISPNGVEPVVNYKKINSTKYSVHISNVTHPFVLFFSELYNPNWQAHYVGNQNEITHIRANLYGNGWIIDRKGDLDMVIEFRLQKWMDLGEKISILSIVAIILGFCVLSFRYKRKSI